MARDDVQEGMRAILSSLAMSAKNALLGRVETGGERLTPAPQATLGLDGTMLGLLGRLGLGA